MELGPELIVPPPGPGSRALLARLAEAQAPMGPAAASPAGIVLARGSGAHLFDVDGNRYVDLAAGFGALLLGHAHPELVGALARQAEHLSLALGDVYPSEPKIELAERLCRLHSENAQAILCQSGSDAVTAALKTAALHSGRSGVIAFEGSYHGLGYAPLAASGLRASYREPFRAALNPGVRFAPYPGAPAELDRALGEVERELRRGDVGAILVEPVLGRGGVVVPPEGFLRGLRAVSRAHGALLIADEIWTGLGRSGFVARSRSAEPDVICFGKGLGGILPLSAAVGSREVMQSWRRKEEVVHTSTFAGAPLACATALATLEVLERDRLAERSRALGLGFRGELEQRIGERVPGLALRGEGLMLGLELGGRPGAGSRLQRALLERGYVTSTGGGGRELLILTPPLTIDESELFAFVPVLGEALSELDSSAGP